MSAARTKSSCRWACSLLNWSIVALELDHHRRQPDESVDTSALPAGKRLNGWEETPLSLPQRIYKLYYWHAWHPGLDMPSPSLDMPSPSLQHCRGLAQHPRWHWWTTIINKLAKGGYTKTSMRPPVKIAQTMVELAGNHKAWVAHYADDAAEVTPETCCIGCCHVAPAEFVHTVNFL
jgi:hypothetical protein